MVEISIEEINIKFITDNYLNSHPILRSMITEIAPHIIADTETCNSQLIFKGTRIMVWQVIELLSTGITPDTILRDYFPQLTREAIFSALKYASGVIEGEEYVPFQ